MVHPIDADIDDFADLDADGGPQLLHDRVYRVRAYDAGGGRMRLRGTVRDTKPAGLYVPGDHEPLVVHHMIVDLVVQLPDLQIVGASAVLDVHPHTQCPRIEDHYRELVGLSIARGFTHKVRELFGGPRGCTHTTALLQAMGPVAIQSTWSMRAAHADGGSGTPRMSTPEDRERGMRFNLNTCHVWAEDGEIVGALRSGAGMEIPVWAERRLRELGRDPDEWRTRMGD